ncbi:MAG: M50 family metallopeptidase [Bacteroidota bacterium]
MRDLTVFFLIILPLGFLFFNLSRFIIILLHELGHAIPAIIFTRKPAEIFIGSNGSGKHVKVNLGKLTINLRLKFFYAMSGGLCYHSNNMKSYQHIIVLIAGSVFTALIATGAIVVEFNYDMHGSLKLLTMLIFISAISSLINNLYPKIKPVLIHNDHATYNDGYQLRRLIIRGKNTDRIDTAIRLYHQQQYIDAIELLQPFQHPKGDTDLFRVTINCYTITGRYDQAKLYTDKYISTIPVWLLNSDDYVNLGVVESRIDDNDEALHLYNKSLSLNPNNIYALNNRGYTYLLKEEYEVALIDLNQAIAIDDKFAYSYNNRGLVYLKQNQPDAALADITHSLMLDANNAYGHRNLGIYYMEKKEYAAALQLFKKAKELDPNTHLIDKYIADAHSV